jgi:hypothetical protein
VLSLESGVFSLESGALSLESGVGKAVWVRLDIERIRWRVKAGANIETLYGRPSLAAPFRRLLSQCGARECGYDSFDIHSCLDRRFPRWFRFVPNSPRCLLVAFTNR